MRGDERDALDMVPVITTALLEEHQLVTGIVVIVDPGTVCYTRHCFSNIVVKSTYIYSHVKYSTWGWASLVV